MTQFDRFERNARMNGLLVDTNLLVLMVVGTVNRERIPYFKRTSSYTPVDWDLLAGILEQISHRYTLPHVLSEVSGLTDLKGPELGVARITLRKLISLLQEIPMPSGEACADPVYLRLGITDAAIAAAARQNGCSVLTNDSGLYTALSADGLHVVMFDHIRECL